MQSFLFYFI